MTNEGNEYFTDILDTLNKYKDCHGQDCPAKSSKKLFAASWMSKKKKWNVT